MLDGDEVALLENIIIIWRRWEYTIVCSAICVREEKWTKWIPNNKTFPKIITFFSCPYFHMQNSFQTSNLSPNLYLARSSDLVQKS